LKTQVTGIGSLFLTHFLSNRVNEIRSANDVALCDNQMLANYHFSLMAKYGIFFLPHKMGAISIVHNKKDIQSLINATEKIIQSDILIKVKN
jgi:glutamate-1-semialdehyde 2,1-aminomutase